MRHVIGYFAAALVLLPAAGAGAQSRDRNWTTCESDNDDLVIRGCTALIKSGRETQENLAIAFKNRCLAYNDRGNRDQAIEDCNQAIKRNPAYPDAFLLRGLAYFNKGDNDRAIESYDQAINLSPNDSAALVERGAAYHAKGDNARAIEDYDLAISLKPNNALAFYVRAVAYQAENQNELAIRDYDQAIQLEPRFSAALSRRGLLAKKMNDAMAQPGPIDPGNGK